MKSKRQEKILELIADHSVQTQEQLLTELNEAGFSTTQATISRDIKQLRIIKELGPDGVYRYATAPKPAEHTFSAKLNLIFRQCITSVDYAQNMIVVKTMPGLANGAASAIDKLNIPEMLGTRRPLPSSAPRSGSRSSTEARTEQEEDRCFLPCISKILP